MRLTTARRLVRESETLDALLDALQAIDAGCDEYDHQVFFEDDAMSLPTFGGTAPRDTRGVWSWDATRLIVGEGGVWDWEIIPREERDDA